MDLVDISAFPVGEDLDYESEEEVELLKSLSARAWGFADSYLWTRSSAYLVLAFGIAPIIGLYLMRFEPGGKPEDRERWVVVGDLPSMHFETDDTPTPALALEFYCDIAQDWADTVLNGQDLSRMLPDPGRADPGACRNAPQPDRDNPERLHSVGLGTPMRVGRKHGRLSRPTTDGDR